ncbi:MAG: ABC transporter permease [Spirochaetales bacterium]|uniref:ABC transporter permease n=1 Tax=Candidatus Thalassospirochaeta sargassi TaxID=3119039 RepID=A0AAJ1II25_9SPIO|nr:ABC transporter permease [Spirochaetales bacterium]
MKTLSWFPLFMGIRNFYSFRKGKKRTMAGAAIAVALSVVPMIVVIEVSDGMIEGITRRFIELETGHVQLAPLDDLDVEAYLRLSEEIETLPEVLNASPVYRGTGLIYSEYSRTGIQLKAMPPDIFEKDQGFRRFLEISGGSFDLRNPSDIMLSTEIASQLDVEAGEQIKLLTAKTTSTGKIILRPEAFTVTGIFSTGYYEVDAMSGYISLDKGEKLFRGEGYLSIQCKIKDPYNGVDDAVRSIQENIDTEMTAAGWYNMQRSMYESLYTTRVLLVFIMGIIIVVAAVNIASSMIIMVIERRADIAIMKSCGTSGRQIRQAFIYTGMITGLSGAAVGTIAGLLISVNINSIIQFFQTVSDGIGNLSGHQDSFSIISASAYYLEEIPVDIDPGKILTVAAAAVLLSVFAAVMPARKAEKMMPLEIMRKH